jgi:hypothetical protein
MPFGRRQQHHPLLTFVNAVGTFLLILDTLRELLAGLGCLGNAVSLRACTR